MTIKEIKEKQLPELNDEFAGEVSEFETLEEYRADIRAKLTKSKEEEAKNKKEEAVIDAIIEKAQMEIPEAMVNLEKMLEQVKPQAERRIKSRLVLEAVAAAEEITATQEDLEAELQRMAEMYQMEVEKVKEIMGEQGKKQILEDLAVKKAADFVVEHAVEK